MKMKISVSLAIICLVVVSTNCLAGQCAPSQQPSDAQNSLGQDSFDTYRLAGSGEDGALMINLAPAGAGLSGLNNKRARKMSAFIPMRGRKDGRVRLAGEQLNVVNPAQQLVNLNQPASLTNIQLHDSDDSSIWHLVGGRAPAATGSMLPTNSVWLTTTNSGSSIVPQQFANQFAAQHAKQQRSFDEPIVLSTSQRAANGLRQQQQQQAMGGADNSEQLISPALFGDLELMKAKPRRAFHPMRGKKSTSIASSNIYEDEDGGFFFGSAGGDGQLGEGDGRGFVL